MPYRASVTPPSSDMEDPLSLAYNHASASKSRSKSSGAIDLKKSEHLTSLYRVGRIVTSIFDRGRHMQYDYRIVTEKTSSSKTRSGSNAVPAHYDVTNTSSQKSSRSSSLDTSTKASAQIDSAMSNLSIRESSRRTSSESSSGRRRRGGMSIT